MKRLWIALIIGATVAVGGVGCVDDLIGGDVWPRIVECGAGVDSLYGDVARILTSDGTAEDMSGAAVRALERLAQEHGAGAIACIVEGIVSDWLAPGASPDPNRLAGAQRGREFLDDHGVEQVLRE